MTFNVTSQPVTQLRPVEIGKPSVRSTADIAEWNRRVRQYMRGKL